MPGTTYQRRAAGWSLLLAASLPATVLAQSDADVLARIEAIRSAASAVSVDGVGSDWSAVPAIPDPRGDLAAPNRDIVSVSVLPTEDAVLVRIATAAAPARDDRAFWINVDLVGGRHPELQIGLSATGNHFVRSFDASGQPRSLSRRRFPAAVDEIVEVALPYEELVGLVRDRGPVVGALARSWVRVVAFTWTRSGNRLGDFASAASYRIVPDPGPLDPVLGDGSDGAGPASLLNLPLDGRWLVSQGGYGYSTHATQWAWDFTRTDEGLLPADPQGSCENQDFFAWDAPVRSPAPATVRSLESGEADVSPCEAMADAPANEVVLETDDGIRIRMAHLRQGSVQVALDDRVAAGEILARVGSSGASTGPHLHVEAASPEGGGATVPLALRDVVVSLNPGDTDPWRRHLARWVPRPGFFVEAAGGR